MYDARGSIRGGPFPVEIGGKRAEGGLHSHCVALGLLDNGGNTHSVVLIMSIVDWINKIKARSPGRFVSYSSADTVTRGDA